MRAQQEWKVDTQASLPDSPLSASTRSTISRAALLVKVMARIFHAGTPLSIRWAMRQVSTRVLPLPAPAKTSSGPCVCSTAARCSGFSLSK